MTKNSFVLQTRLNGVVAKLSDKQAGVLFKGILNYAENGTVANFEDSALVIAFEFVRQDLDYNAEKYNDTCNKRKLAIQKRWEHTKNTNVYKCIQSDTKSYKRIHNDNDVDNDNDIDVDNNIFSKEKDKKEKLSRFIKPTVEEIRSYCLSRSNGIDAQAFYDFYESKGWKVGTTPMKNWQAAINTWERRQKQEVGNGTDYNKQPETGKYAGFGRKIGA